MLLISAHAPTVHTRALSEALAAGANDDALDVEVVVRAPDLIDATDITAASGILLLTPANFGYMSGLTKDLFDRTFLAIGGSLSEDGSAGGTGGAAGRGRTPFGLCVHGRYDTEGAVRSVLSIVGALPWTQAAPVLSVLGDVTDDHRTQAYELGATLAALIS